MEFYFFTFYQVNKNFVDYLGHPWALRKSLAQRPVFFIPKRERGIDEKEKRESKEKKGE